jgi:atypical dual specificity phosphatase
MTSNEGPWPLKIDWVLEDRLAAFSAFALADPDRLEELGIRAIVSLTEEPPPELVGTTQFEILRLPITDMTAPETEQIERFVRFVDGVLDRGDAVGVHCLAGLGRTGTMIACYLVTLGRSADDAIDEVRRVRPGSIQTEYQEQAVRRWAMMQSGESNIGRFL